MSSIIKIVMKRQRYLKTFITLMPICYRGQTQTVLGKTSCNKVAPVTNLCLGRATTRSHSSQWSKKKSCS